MTRQGWTRDQLLTTLALYCQIPFGKMHSRNPAVIALAGQIGRTASAVALKLVNFASLDPDLQGRGVGGMGNTSAADRDVWAEFYGRWEVLADYALASEPPTPVGHTGQNQSTMRTPPTGPTEVMREAMERRGQSFFRSAVLAAHNGKCCITGVTSEALLRASHIVPWARDPTLRLDPRNGLCLNALHDAAFDGGLITLTDRFELKVSKRLKDEVPGSVYIEMFESRRSTPITMPERFKPSTEMLEFHRSTVFVD